jgi:hypothetical protein
LSVGAVLLQPQRLTRTQPTDDSVGAEIGDAATLVAAIAYDAVKGGHVADTIEAAGEAFGERLVAQAQGGFANATTRLAALVESPLDALHAKALEFGSIDGPDAALAAAQDLVGAVTGLAEALTIDHIRATLTEVLDIVETDFGLTPNVLEEQIWALVDDLVDRLEHVAPEPDVALRRNRLRIIGALRRLRRRLFDQFHFPQLDVEQLAEELFALIERTGLSDAAARVACVGAGVGQIAQSSRDLLHVVPFTGLLPSVGAGVTPDAPASDERYLWYPSWLANNHRPFLIDLAMLVPDDDVVITSAGELLQRNSLRANNSIATNVQNWKDTPKIGDADGEYSFGLIPADTMETIAWVSSIAANGFEMLFHLISIEEGDHLSNIWNAVGGAGYGTWKALKRKPFPWYLEGPARGAGTLGWSVEGMHTKANFGNCVAMWATLAGPDLAEMLTYRYLLGVTRDLVLSTLTLMNHVPPPSGTPDQNAAAVHPRNREEFDGVRHACMIGFINLYLLAYKREDWGIMKAGDKAPLWMDLGFWTFLGGIGVGGVGGLVGSALGSAIARDVDSDALLHKVWWGIPQAWGTIMYWLYLQQEGSTSDGTYTPFSGGDFAGYPKKDTSPYLLPYDSSAVGSCYVGQANQGFWSHNLGNVGQVYAYDFSLDQDSEVLCARDGVVVAYSQCIPNDTDNPGTTVSAKLQTAIAKNAAPTEIDVDSTLGFQPPGILLVDSGSDLDVAFFSGMSDTQFTGVTWQGGKCRKDRAKDTGIRQKTYGWNFVAVRHTTPNTDHDKGLGGAAVGTVAVYGHGRTGSVGDAFGGLTHPVAPEAIMGATVTRGMPIMRAGDTGVSFHNHLHMHVIADPNPGDDPGRGGWLSFGGLGSPAVTIPFVFADEDVGNGGVPTHFNWYTSSNPRTLG